MTTPNLNEMGLLPPGVHEMTLNQIKGLFGSFQETDIRPSLFSKLEDLINTAKQVDFIKFIIVNGSFVTSKPQPNDIDLIIVIDKKILGQGEWTPSEYNLLSSRRLRRKYRFDVFVIPEDSEAYEEYVDLFSKVKESPDSNKGIVRVSL